MPSLRANAAPPHILIAEDDTALAAVLKRLILRYDPDAMVSLYENGRDALAAYDVNGADLIIAGYLMPHMNGPSFIRTLRSRGDTIPVIGISGDAGNADAFRAAGATVFLDGVAFTTNLLPLVLSLLLFTYPSSNPIN